MNERDLQRLTTTVDYIGHGAAPRRVVLPARRNNITQKIKIAGHRTLYLSVHDDQQPAEIFHRLKGSDCSSELIGLYDVIARLMSLPLQYVPLEKVGDLLTEAGFGRYSPVSGRDGLKECTSPLDFIGRHSYWNNADERSCRIAAPQHDV